MKQFILLFVVSLFISSCTDCNLLVDIHRKDECLLIIEKFPESAERLFNYKGIHPKTGQKCNCESGSSYRWWNLYKDKIDIGDTIIKKKGELVFSVHKKDTILKFNFECEGRVYD